MQPKVLDAIERLFYIIMHLEKFDSIAIPITICLLKLVVEAYLELVCLCLTSISTKLSECIMDFIALGVISDLDERYYESIRNPLKDKLQTEEYKLPITVTEKRKVKNKKMSWGMRAFWTFMYVIKFLYEVIYFHCVPYYLLIAVYTDKYVLWNV